MLTKFARRKRFVDHLLGAVGTFSTATCHAEALPKLAQGTRAFTYGVADLTFGNSIAEANVHGAPQYD
jgi:hypothetical protein